MRYVDTRWCQRERLIKTARHLLCAKRTRRERSRRFASPYGFDCGLCPPLRMTFPTPYGATTHCVRSVHGGRDPDALRRPTGSTPLRLRSGQQAIACWLRMTYPRPTGANAYRVRSPHARRHFTAKARPNFRYRLLATKRALNCVLRKFIARQTKSPTFVIVRALRTPSILQISAFLCASLPRCGLSRLLR